MRRSNGGVIGSRVVPSTSSSDGVWGIADQAELARANLWTKPATFALTSSAVGGSVSEGQTLTITLTTTGVREGTIYPYTVTGSISSADLTAGSLSGNLVINNGQAQTSFTFANDYSLNEGDETLQFAAAGQTLNFTVVDSSVVTYQLSRTAANINEGESVTITLATVNGSVPNGYTVPYTVTGISAADLSAGSLTGNFTFTSNSASTSFTLANDATTEGTETLTLTAAGQSIQVSILDTSVTPLSLSGSVSYYTSANAVTAVTIPAGSRGARIHMWAAGGRNDGGTAGGGYMRGEGFWPAGVTAGSTIYVIVGGAGYRAGGNTAGSADPDGKCKAAQGWTDTGGGMCGVFTVNPRSSSNETNSASTSQILLVAGGGGAGYGGTPGPGGYPNGVGGSGTGGATQTGPGYDAGNGGYYQSGAMLLGTRRYGSSGTYAGGGGFYPGGCGCNYGGASGGGGGASGYINTSWTLQDYLTGQTGTTPVGSGKAYYSGSYGGGTQQGQVVIEWMN